MKTIEEMIEVMQAFKDGKKIERRSKENLSNQQLRKAYYPWLKPEKMKSISSTVWKETAEPMWDWCSFDYRIKSEPHYIPYDSVDEIDRDKWVKTKGTDKICRIDMFDKADNRVEFKHMWYTLKEMYKACEYEDGTPFGKAVY